MEMQTTAFDVANAIVARHGETGYITNLKLNKLVYFAYAFFLRNGCKLFDDPIEAWPYGPVIPDVYHAYKSHGSSRVKIPVSHSYGQLAARAADVVWGLYGNLTAYDLVDLSHKEGGAWRATPRYSQITDLAILGSVDAAPESRIMDNTIANSIGAGMERWGDALERLRNS